FRSAPFRKCSMPGHAMRLRLRQGGRMPNSVRVSVAGRDDSGDWEAYVDAHGDAAGYHSWRWQRVFANAFGHQPIYLIARDGGAVRGVLPTVQIKSLLFGRTLTSLPFLHYGGGVADAPEQSA